MSWVKPDGERADVPRSERVGKSERYLLRDALVVACLEAGLTAVQVSRVFRISVSVVHRIRRGIPEGLRAEACRVVQRALQGARPDTR